VRVPVIGHEALLLQILIYDSMTRPLWLFISEKQRVLAHCNLLYPYFVVSSIQSNQFVGTNDTSSCPD
jgi:hypothetical protein